MIEDNNNIEEFTRRLNEIIKNGDYFKVLATAEHFVSKMKFNGLYSILTGEDLLNELIAKVYEGDRKYNPSVKIVVWLKNNLLSVAGSYYKSNGNKLKFEDIYTEFEDNIEINYADRTINIEQEIEATEEIKILLSMLKDESAIVLIEKLKNNELKNIAKDYGLDIKDIYNCNRDIMRKALKLYSN